MTREEIFKYSKENNKVIMIYPYGSDGKCTSGVVLDYNEEYLLIRQVDKNGHIDGFCAMLNTRDMFLMTDDLLTKRLNRLVEFRNIDLSEDLNIQGERDLIEFLLKKARDEQEIISIYTFMRTACFSAKVLDIDDEKVLIQMYDYFGREDGTVSILYDDMESVFYKTDTERTTQVLVGVTLNEKGYNGDLTSKQAGSIGGRMVKKMIQSYESSMQDN